VDVVPYLPADPQTAEPVQMSKRTLDNPALGTETGPVLGAPARDDRLHPEGPDEAAVLVVVVTPVAEDDGGPPPGPPALAPHRRDRFE
jgi:hypothetical protein